MSLETSRPIIVIAGPTCSGKSKIAIKLAKDINGVIINGDSRQVYEELNIGTAKPSVEEMENIEHYLYGHISVREHYNISRYQQDVSKVLDSIPQNKVPIIVGGTGLYIDSVVFNYKLSNMEENNIEKELSNDVSELEKLIPEDILKTLNESDRQNPVRLQRIIRRGEIENEKGVPLNHLYFVVDIPKEELREKISKRVDTMIEDGLIEENKNLRQKDLNIYPAFRSIGYREFDGYFEGKKDIDEVKNDIVNHTNQYAKRQRTWFRRNKNAIWTNSYDFVLATSLRFINTL
jgi:tRNA dimethylallyltransferase